jgi:hypothetical protein
VAELQAQMARDDFPRLTVLLLLTLSGAGALATSVLSLRMGLSSMGLRYALSTIAGYAAFVVLVRGWIALRRGELDAVDVLDVASPEEWPRVAPATKAAPPLDAAHDAAFADVPVEAARTGGSGALEVAADGVLGAFDLDDFWWLLLVAALAFGGVLALIYVVYGAPALLAEVALDAALVSTLYRRLRREDVGHWFGTVVRRTVVPALVLVAFMGLAGFGLQQVAPQATSIGGVVARLTAGR